MAVEKKRGCGYRKTGGLYLVSDGEWVGCDRIPIALDICPTCRHGIKQTRGWTWIEPVELLGGLHGNITDQNLPACSCVGCVVCNPALIAGEHACGLLWIGTQFYKTSADFSKEMREMGLSRRITAIPRDFKIGETWVLLAHPKAVENRTPGAENNVFSPGIFTAVKPSRVELILKDTEYTDAKKAELEKKGITPVVVPHDDKDHQGSVYTDKHEEGEDAA